MRKFYKLAISLLMSVSIASCANTEHNMVIVPTGEMQKSVLLAEYEEFGQEYKSASLSELELEQVGHWPDDLVIDIFFGTWCHDSQREVPRLLKALVANPKITVNLLALDTTKSEPAGRGKKAGVQYTPTFIVTRAGVELGRIVETPVQDLVTDINEMLTVN